MHKFKYFFRAIALSVKIKSPISMIISIIGFGIAFLPMLISLQLAVFTDGVQGLFNNPDTLNTVLFSFAFLAMLYITQTCFSFVQNYYSGKDSARIGRYLKEQMMQFLSSIPYKYIENHDNFREKVDFVNSFAAGKTTGSIVYIFNWIANIISFVSISFILFNINPWIVFILIVTCIPAVILSRLQQDETYRHRTKFMKEGMFVLTYSEACRRNEAMKEIRFLGLYPHIKEKWHNLGASWVAKKNKIIRKHVIFNSIADLLHNGVYLFIVLFTVWEIFNDPTKGLGTFMLVIAAAGQLQGITTTLFINTVGIFTDVKYIEDFFVLLETEKENIDDTQTGFDDVHITFDQVSFTYPNSEHKALDGLTVNIRQGEKIAVVGANGSGKSTFVNLLCGLYAPDSGTAKINDIEITQNLSRVRRSLSVIFQKFCQYQDTLRNNIKISDPTRADEDSEILALMRRTGADEVVKSQEKALDEMIGIFSEKGNNLSGGQWQKVAITRALFRQKARVYILDEPTASLDPVLEANIYRNFASLAEDKTAILVSHRLGITSVVDRILVFDNGKIVEDGSFIDLIKRNGVFAKMYQAQAKWYIEETTLPIIES
ncbi:MAG: ABC transporter ATP-binding protein/permease [Clostridium sp.]|jgi:ABC-type multidrug transport system fused ATPase/permease subunit|nr:ABC transporter ATP-binding protein/permease [Clostridium sp.]